MREDRWRVAQVLRKWGACDSRRAELRRRLAEIHEEMLDVISICSPAMSGMPGGGQVGQPTEKKALKLAEIEKRYEDRLNDGDKELLAIFTFETAVETALAELTVEQERVLRLRYRNGKSYERIATETGYSLDRVFHLHSEGLDALAELELFAKLKVSSF